MRSSASRLPRFLRLCVAAACLPAALALPRAVAAQESRTTSAAQGELEARLAELRDAETRLETRYLTMEALYGELVRDVDDVAARAATVLLGARAAIVERIGAPLGSKAPGRTAQVQAFRDAIATELSNQGVLPVEFAAALGAILAESLLDSFAKDEPATLQTRVRELFGGVLDPSVDFAEAWNAGLFTHVPEAAAYAKANAAYVEAGRAVERARSPERFSADGERLPSGLVEVKGGTYEFGPHAGWPRPGTEKRARKISVKTFWIERTEVTNAAYMTFFKTLAESERLQHLPRYWTVAEDGTVSYPAGRDEHPVVGVNFQDAQLYAAWAGRRLPTEEEWEVAARGPKGFLYPWGPAYEGGRANDREAGLGDTAAVGSFPAGESPFGCVDMAGNVDEWTASIAEGDPITAPLDTNANVVVRGGNFATNQEGVAATFRWLAPGLSTRKTQLGFRCAQTPARK